MRRRPPRLPGKGWLPLLLAALLWAASPYLEQAFQKPAAQQNRQAVVTRVIDGDTVVLDDGEHLRYIGVDTPELSHPNRRTAEEPYAREATSFNRELVEGKPVRLEFDLERRDKYKRLLAYVYLEDGTFVNAELIRRGYGQILTIPPNVKHADLFHGCQQEAREARRGLWGIKKR